MRCGHTRISYNSCRNRHCPKCQALARAEWLEARKADLLPVPYFHVVFTLPEPVAAIALQNQRVVYDILFRTAAATLKTIAADPRHLGAEIGFIAVLHTWGQTLQYHPHLHCVVPGGGLAPDGEGWIACRPGFFLPVRVLSSLFRRLFLEALDAAFQAGELSFHASLARTGGARPVRAVPQRRPRRQVGGLRQAAVRRPGAGVRVSRPLHPPGRHFQQPAGQDRGRQRRLPLEGLPAS